MYTISFLSPETLSEVQAQGVWESERKARNYASSLSLSYADVRVWRGQPGEFLVASYNDRCDAERFGDRCVVCSTREVCKAAA